MIQVQIRTFWVFFCPGLRDLKVTVLIHWSVGPSVSPLVSRSVCRSHVTFFAFLSCLKVEKFRYEYFMVALTQIIPAPAQLITATAQHITAPAQLIATPAQPPVTGVAVYTALFPDELVVLVV